MIIQKKKIIILLATLCCLLFAVSASFLLLTKTDKASAYAYGYECPFHRGNVPDHYSIETNIDGLKLFACISTTSEYNARLYIPYTLPDGYTRVYADLKPYGYSDSLTLLSIVPQYITLDVSLSVYGGDSTHLNNLTFNKYIKIRFEKTETATIRIETPIVIHGAIAGYDGVDYYFPKGDPITFDTVPYPAVEGMEFVAWKCANDSGQLSAYFAYDDLPKAGYPYTFMGVTYRESYAPVYKNTLSLVTASFVTHDGTKTVRVEKGQFPLYIPDPTASNTNVKFKHWSMNGAIIEAIPSLLADTTFTAHYNDMSKLRVALIIQTEYNLSRYKYLTLAVGDKITYPEPIPEFVETDKKKVFREWSNAPTDGVITAEHLSNYCASGEDLTIRTEYDEYFVQSLVYNYVNENNVLTSTTVPWYECDDMPQTGAYELHSFERWNRVNNEFTAVYADKDVVVKSSLGETTVKLYYETVSDAYVRFHLENTEYRKRRFADWSDSEVTTAVLKDIEKYKKETDTPEKFDVYGYYFYYNFFWEMLDKPMPEQDIGFLTYIFSPYDTVKKLFPTFDRTQHYFGLYGETKSLPLNLSFMTIMSNGQYSNDFISGYVYSVDDITKPIELDIQTQRYLKLTNSHNKLTFTTSANTLKFTDGIARIVLDLANPFGLKEFWGDFHALDVTGVLLAYEISVDKPYTCTVDVLTDKKELYIYVPEKESGDYNIVVNFKKKLIPGDPKTAFEKFLDMMENVADFFVGFYDRVIAPLANSGWLIPLVIALVVVIVVLISFPSLIPLLFKGIFWIITLPIRLIIMLVKKIQNR